MLEVALLQEEWESCERILSLCEESRVRIIVPGYSLIEPYETLKRRQKERKEVGRRLDKELKKISRTATYREKLSGFDEIIELFAESAEEDNRSLNRTCSRILDIADSISLDSEVLKSADSYRRQYRFSPQDAIVYASVLSHLDNCHSSMSFFVTRDRDFIDPDIASELQRYNCTLLSNFGHAYRVIRRSLS
ncbi:MAG: PIN domain-containing protein [Alphaproteobacteria bacterium]|nr:PIN domain-containing protein [Alphaproteobacteria bacterium]